MPPDNDITSASNLFDERGVLLFGVACALAGGLIADIPRRSPNLKVGDDELARRRASWKQPPPPTRRGYGRIICKACHASQRGMRLRFSRARRARCGSGDSLRAAALWIALSLRSSQ
jgi:hypothetical protein